MATRVAAAQSETDTTKRNAVRAHTQEIISEEQALMQVAYSPYVWEKQSDVTGSFIGRTGNLWLGLAGLTGKATRSPTNWTWGRVVTADGPLDPGELGPTLTHEHILIDLTSHSREPVDEAERELAREPPRMEPLGRARHDPLLIRDALLIEDRPAGRPSTSLPRSSSPRRSSSPACRSARIPTPARRAAWPPRWPAS